MQDEWVPKEKSEALMSVFGEKKMSFEHPGGHVMPHGKEVKQILKKFLSL